MRNLLTDKIAEAAANNKNLFSVKPETIFDDMTQYYYGSAMQQNMLTSKTILKNEKSLKAFNLMGSM
jgi:hypothetical protein